MREVAYIKHFVHVLKAQCEGGHIESDELTNEDLARAEFLIYREVQSKYYTAELKEFKEKKSSISKCLIFKLSPFVDDHNVLRA